MTWQEATIRLNERDVYAVLDTRFSDMAPIAELPCLHWLGLWSEKAGNGQASAPEVSESWFMEVENKLLEVAGRISDGWAVYCARLVTRGVAEYYFYAKDEGTLAGLLPELQSQFPGRRMAHQCKRDAAGSEYSRFLAALP